MTRLPCNQSIPALKVMTSQNTNIIKMSNIKRRLPDISRISDFINPLNKNRLTLTRSCLMVFLLGTPTAILIVRLTNHLLSSLGVYDIEWAARSNNQVSGFDIFGTVLLSPILETFLLGWFIDVICKKISKKLYIALLAAFVFAALHGLTSIYWFFGPLWLFFLMSYSYLIWRSHSYQYAFISACIPHMLNNLTSVLMIKLI